MSGSRLEARLAARAADEAAVRAVSAILEWLPGEGDLSDWSSFEDGAAAMGRGDAEAARKLADGDEATRALRVFDALDEGEDVVSIASGVGTALRLAFSSGKGAAPAGLAAMLLRQRSDAADKILGVGVALSRCFPGTPAETLRRTRALPSGELLLRWLASVELFLPFVDQAVRSSPTGWLAAEQEPALARVRAAMTDAELVDAKALWPVLVEELVARVEALGHTPLDLAKLGFARLPRLAGVVDAAGAVAAGAVDYLPVYHLLGERVVAEALLDGGGWRPAAAAAPAFESEGADFEFVVPPELRTTGDEAPDEGPGPPAAPVPAEAPVEVAVAAVEPAAVTEAAEPERIAAIADPEPEAGVVGGDPEPVVEAPVAVPVAAPAGAPAPVAPAAIAVAPVVTREVTPSPEPVVVRTPTPEPALAPPPSRPRPAAPLRPARPEAASRPTPQGTRPRAAAPPREEPSGGGGMLGLGAGVVVLVGLLCGGGALAAGGAWWFFASKGSPPALVASPPGTPTATPAVPAPTPLPAAVPVAPPAPVYPAVPAAAPTPTPDPAPAPAAAPAPAPAPKAAPAPTRSTSAVKQDGKPFEPKKKRKKKDRSDR